MRKKKVLSPPELETEKILKAELPEYDIRANHRLADVIHMTEEQFKYMGGYHLDFAICDKHANIIAAVELDDNYHNTPDGKRKDDNKNRWLNKAGIMLFRIQEPKDAYTIREKMGLANNLNYFHESRPTFVRSKQINPVTKYIGRLITIFAIVGLLMWTLNSIVLKMSSSIGKNTVTQTQAAENRRMQQETRQAEVQQKVNAQQPKYERMLIKGKSARECTNSNVITNETINCTKDHYEMVLISGTQ